MKDAIQNGAEEKAFIYVLFSSFCVLLSHRYVYSVPVPPTRVYFLTRSSFVWQKDKKEREKENKT